MSEAPKMLAALSVVDEIDRIKRMALGVELACMGIESQDRKFGAGLVELVRMVRVDLENLSEEICSRKPAEVAS
jgi:hypothetical protein